MKRVTFEVINGGMIDFADEEWNSMTYEQKEEFFLDSYYWELLPKWRVVDVKQLSR